MAKKLVGKCPVCGRRVAIYRSRYVRPRPDAETAPVSESRIVLATHSPVSGGDVGVAYCRGGNMEPAPDPKLDRERQRRELKRQAKLRALLAPFRPHAAVVLDALVDGVGWSRAEVKILARVTLYYHRLYWPGVWVGSVLRYVARANKRGERSGQGDCYCAFCGRLMFTNIWGRRTMAGWVDDTPYLDKLALQGDAHAVVCALIHFVHERPPVDPSVRRLPPEYVQDEEPEA